ncbi:JAB domain-containing protein [Myxococcota bacterium]|nr:JAB domain-containing protein [Myxococcota bacterium]MBU1382884.1 JAB domain-containing protein [Myxococcota bacterium]MBU1496690.1 JAB domain-containing protein [Myxococcota bacterium]
MKTALGTLIGNEDKALELLNKIPLRNLLFLSKHELHEAGLSYQAASRLESAINLVTTAMKESLEITEKLLCSKEVYSFILKQIDYSELQTENFWILNLDVKQHPLSFIKIGEGGMSETRVSIRKIVKSAFAANAARMILAHNHPSGNPEPSDMDHKLTDYLRETLKPMDIEVIDHIVIGHGRYYSFADNGY